MKSNKRVVVFYEIHPLNYIPALLISLLWRVVYWRKSFLTPSLVRRFEQIYLHGSFTQGEWVEITAPIFFEVKKCLKRKRFSDRVFVKYRGSSIDLTLAAMQRVVMQYERITHFYRLLDLWIERQEEDPNYQVVDFVLNRHLQSLELGVDSRNHQVGIAANCFLDSAWETLNCLTRWSGAVVKVLSGWIKPGNQHPGPNVKNIKYYWYSLSFNEIASAKNSYDVTTLVRRGLLDSDESLFVLPVDPDENQRTWLADNGIKWIAYRSLSTHIPRSRQLLTLLWLLSLILSPGRMVGKAALKNLIKAPLISHIFNFEYFYQIDAEVLLTGQSWGLTESPIVSLARGLGKKTVWWSYAGVGSKHIPNPLPFKYCNEQVEESITLSEEKWIWFELDKRMLTKRSLIPLEEEDTTFRALGPVMSGDSRWIGKSPAQARMDYQFEGSSVCKFWITIFDLPTLEHYRLTEHRWPICSFTEERQSEFFRDIGELLERFPDFGVIFKPKRPISARNSGRFIYQPELLNMIESENKWVRSGRLIVLSNNIDPYIPIALCDFAIAVPYTSALLAVLASGRDGVYYEPSVNISKTYPPALNNFTINNKSGLFEKIETWKKGDDEVDTSLLDLIAYKGDPGENIAEQLRRLA